MSAAPKPPSSTSTAFSEKDFLAEPIIQRFDALLRSRRDRDDVQVTYMQARYIARRADFDTLPFAGKSIVYTEWAKSQCKSDVGDRGVALAEAAVACAREARELQKQIESEGAPVDKTVDQIWIEAITQRNRSRYLMQVLGEGSPEPPIS